MSNAGTGECATAEIIGTVLDARRNQPGDQRH
jgi:hypothetical protein